MFTKVVHIYDIAALNSIYLSVCLILVLLFSFPTLVEALKIGAAFLHGLDQFLLTPIAVVDVVIDVFALRGLTRNFDNVLSPFNVFLTWVTWTIMVVLLFSRVISERITRLQTLQAWHAPMHGVDFFWTAPPGVGYL